MGLKTKKIGIGSEICFYDFGNDKMIIKIKGKKLFKKYKLLKF